MSASTLSLRSQWIISRNQDLTFFICSAGFGYLLLAAALPSGTLPIAFIAAFTFAVDGPHVYSTATRTVLDGEQRRRLGLLWLAIVPLCLFAPLFGFLFGGIGLLITIASLSHYHVSKQHMGFVMLYKRKFGEREDYKLDKYFTLTSLFLPFLFYLSVAFTASVVLLPLFLVSGATLLLWYGWHQSRKECVNWPKVLLLLAFIPLQWAAWGFAALDPLSVPRLLTVGIILNVGHSLQYLRLMYFHNHNRYAEGKGVLSWISRKWIHFMAAAVVLAVPVQLSRFQNKLVSGVVVGFLLFHFIADSRIWRVRNDPELARALNL